jgi:hypothetical protein
MILSQIAFALGACGGLARILTPAAVNTASKEPVNWPARSLREFGVLKYHWAMLPLRVRRVYRVRLHVDLTILAQLASALIKTRT